ncbi:MAG: hypothetical protein EBX17_05005, partial [Betaproteobacteria bacterium]|nr:hypothetical protein [Betaproteobacteria bacterium]
LEREAKRLHLSEDEVNRLIERVNQEKASLEDQQGIPLARLVQDPQLALERFRELAGQVRQIALMASPDEMRRLVDDSDRLTELEKRIWRQL